MRPLAWQEIQTRMVPMTAVTKPVPYLDIPPEWIGGFTAWLPERGMPVRRVGFTLRDLVRRGLFDAEAVESFSRDTQLTDFAWRLLWAGDDREHEAESLGEAVRYAQGVLIFIHGWDGSGEIWEDLPAQVIQETPHLIALVPDVNGFGGTPFDTPLPPLDKCDPPAVMQSLQQWIDLLGLRAAGKERLRPFIFIGHSMGGAALFFLDESLWKPGEVGRIATAPALLMNDRARQRFYRALGAGIRFSGWSDLVDQVAEEFFAPRVIETFAGQASERVRAEHHRIFKSTPEGVIAQTFAAMGLLDVQFDSREWHNFHVFLGHKDRLVGLQPTLDLLETINFAPGQIRIALGDHYFFSIGSKPHLHAQNRTLLIKDILGLHHRLLRNAPLGGE